MAARARSSPCATPYSPGTGTVVSLLIFPHPVPKPGLGLLRQDVRFDVWSGTMAIRINTNVPALQIAGRLGQTVSSLGRSYGRLASGFRIATAADDAAGSAISERMRADVRSLKVAQRNIQDGVSLVQVAEGALGEFADILLRTRELAMQAANGTLSDSDREVIELERNELAEEAMRLIETTMFNGITLFERGSPLVDEGIQIQAGSQESETLSLEVLDTMRIAEVLEALSFRTIDRAQGSLALLDISVDVISRARGQLGAFQNRLDAAGRVVATRVENLSAAHSRIKDLDFASEMAEVTRLEILQQSGALMLAQANAAPELALELLQPTIASS